MARKKYIRQGGSRASSGENVDLEKNSWLGETRTPWSEEIPPARGGAAETEGAKEMEEKKLEYEKMAEGIPEGVGGKEMRDKKKPLSRKRKEKVN